MARGEEFGKDAVENLKLAGDAEQGGVARAGGVDGPLDLLEAEGVVANLSRVGVSISTVVRREEAKRTLRNCMI